MNIIANLGINCVYVFGWAMFCLTGIKNCLFLILAYNILEMRYFQENYLCFSVSIFFIHIHLVKKFI